MRERTIKPTPCYPKQRKLLASLDQFAAWTRAAESVGQHRPPSGGGPKGGVLSWWIRSCLSAVADGVIRVAFTDEPRVKAGRPGLDYEPADLAVWFRATDEEWSRWGRGSHLPKSEWMRQALDCCASHKRLVWQSLKSSDVG